MKPTVSFSAFWFILAFFFHIGTNQPISNPNLKGAKSRNLRSPEYLLQQSTGTFGF